MLLLTFTIHDSVSALTCPNSNMLASLRSRQTGSSADRAHRTSLPEHRPHQGLTSSPINSSNRQEIACMRAGQGVAAQGMAIRVGLSKADVQERRALCASARTTNSVTTSLDIAAKPHESAHGLRGPRIRCCSAVMIIHDWTVSEMRHLVPWKMTHPRR